jgi:hypothetical protein
LRSALDCAYWDLFGKLERPELFGLKFHPKYSQLPESSITISVGTAIETQLEKIEKSAWT